jgi:hypothetical protein
MGEMLALDWPCRSLENDPILMFNARSAVQSMTYAATTLAGSAGGYALSMMHWPISKKTNDVFKYSIGIEAGQA